MGTYMLPILDKFTLHRDIDTKIANFILRKWKEATKMCAEHRVAFDQYNSTLDATKTAMWATQSLEPRLEKGKWVSVFSMPETNAMSMSQKMRNLLLREQTTPPPGSSRNPDGLAAWISSAINLQLIQVQLREDIQSAGTKPTAAQQLGFATRRKAILAQAQPIRAAADKYFFVGLQYLPSDNNDARDGEPEWLPLLLPSDYNLPLTIAPAHHVVVDVERELRRTFCLRDLQRVHSLTMQRVHLDDSKQKHARGVIATTRAASLQQKLRQRLIHAQTLYNITAGGC
ncbi:hypothetical protein FRC08_017065 [Ceratobasidium sp. 394]|nr:hypothetical protein FRC08_017065 [Ceratobasidium sp. 394]